MELEVTARQRAFIEADADEVLFGGAAGGGKSYGQMADALIYALRYPNSRQLILRRTLPELDKSLVRIARSLYPAAWFTYRKGEHSGVFVNGSVLDFGYLDSEGDMYKYQSAEYDVIRFDELTHFSEQMYVYLISRCRGANDFPKRIKSTANPGGVGHGWVKARFVDIGPPDTVYRFQAGSRIFLPSKATDNLFLMRSDPNYLKRLQNLPDKERKALLDGCWDLFEGQYFTEWNRRLHVIEPFELPDGALRYLTMDYGLDMLAAFLIAVDSAGNAYVYRELYEGKDNGGEGHIVSSAAARIREMCAGERIARYFAPPDLWSRTKDSGKSIAGLFSECGIPLTRVPNDRAAGWLRLREWLRPRRTESGEMLPRLRIFSNCINLIRTLPALQYSASNPSDVAATPHELTHAPDALRYFASADVRPSVPPKAAPHYSFSFERPRPAPSGLGDKIQII